MRPLAFATAVDPRRQDFAPTPLWPRWVTLLDAISWHEPWHATRFSPGSASPSRGNTGASQTASPTAVSPTDQQRFVPRLIPWPPRAGP